MQAFHNDPKIKSTYLTRVLQHQKLDEIIKGTYWEKGKGCAVGCTIHDSDHEKYEKELGIPEWLAHLEDRIFEGLPNGRAKVWPSEFLSAIKVGSDLEKVKAPFLIFVCESALETFDHEKFPDCKKAIEGVISLWRMPEEQRTDAAYAYAAYAYAARAADAAAYAYAARAADAAADAAAYAYAARAAYAYAARAARAAAYAARAAAYAADAAAYAAAYAAYAAADAADAAWVKFADKLLELLRECE